MTPHRDDEDKPLVTRVAILRSDMNRVLDILDGRPGEKGLKQEFTDFFTWSKTRDEEKQIYEHRLSRRINTTIAIGLLIIAILGYIMSRRDKAGHSMLSDSTITITAEYDANAK